ncbi:hypothetical protein [Chelativorans salis]|uniref:GlsB/YeaQ/YmgE family stress response membrane protein n=1 Tax=Chelativorans salis TaxID=2978478 RepID=A0ABT2LSJ6_9HYPH|nr:hypothetical protein [Chelativorans sp. EGI FJ00035]MCT7377454.1 hypothetical protein [Chelativorans sp. EGI FJ00035]
MLMKLDASWLIFAIVTVALLAYLFSIALNALLHDAGFGVLGNTAIIMVGFFGAIQAVNMYGTRFGSLLDAALAGLVGAFILFMLLVLAKLALSRLI